MLGTNELATHTWDYENRVVVIETASERHTMAYDADGLRRQWDEADTVKKFIWDNQDVLLETDDGGTTQVAYTVSPALYGEVLAQRKDNASRFYQFDGLGSTTELTDANEAETDSFRYKAFGEALSTSGATHPPFQYVGKLGYYRHPDTEIGMDYVRARWYRPRIGRFISPDPLLTLGSPYPYATNNPAALVDVSGMQPIGIGGVIAFDQCLNNPNLASSIGSSECADQLAIVRHYENEVLSWAEALPGEQDAAALTGHCTGLTMTMRAACSINCLPPGPMAGYGPCETFVKYCTCGCSGSASDSANPGVGTSTVNASVASHSSASAFLKRYVPTNNPPNAIDPSGRDALLLDVEIDFGVGHATGVIGTFSALFFGDPKTYVYVIRGGGVNWIPLPQGSLYASIGYACGARRPCDLEGDAPCVVVQVAAGGGVGGIACWGKARSHEGNIWLVAGSVGLGSPQFDVALVGINSECIAETQAEPIPWPPPGCHMRPFPFEGQIECWE